MATLTTEIYFNEIFRNSYESTEVEIELDAADVVRKFDEDELLYEMDQENVLRFVLEEYGAEAVCMTILGHGKSAEYVSLLSRDKGETELEVREKVVNDLLLALRQILLPPIPAEASVVE